MINPDLIPLPHDMRPKLTTNDVPPFSRRSKEHLYMPDELRIEAQRKHEYLKTHLDNMKAYLATYKVNDPYEFAEFGKMALKNSTKYRLLNARKWTALVNEIQLMQGEVDRLQAILTA